MTRQNGAANRAEDADGVTFVRIGLTPSAVPKANASTATIALYAGMTAAELQSILRATLHLASSTICAGFAVPLATQETPRRHAKGKHASAVSATTRERIVPLTVACVSPSVLHTPTGYARVLISSPFSSASSVKSDPAAATQRLQRLVTALKDEDKSLSSFEAAVLAEICEQQVEQVLKAVQNPQQSLESKKQYLLSLVRRGNDAEASRPAPTAAAVANVQRPSNVGDATGVAQVDLICKKVVAIAHTVFSPHVQSDLMTEASLFREKQRKVKLVRGQQHSGSASTLADGSVSSMMELLGVVERLLNKHALQEEQSVKLIRLILGENRLLFSALQSYKTDYNLNELENTVKRMAALSSGPAASPTAADIPAEAGLRSPSKKKAKVARKERQGFVVRPHDILHTLYQKSMITTLELDLLRALVNQQDAQVLASVAEYERTRSLEILRNQLVAIVDEITLELGDEEKMGNGQHRAVDDMDDDDQEGVSIDHWQERLIQFVQRMFGLRKLTADQVHVLRALIEEDHNLLQSAFEVFASDGDENELLDTLQRIAKLQLQANEGALIAAFNQIVDEHCEVLRATEKKLVKQLFARKNELARAAWEVYEVEQNLEDFGDTLLRIARFATRQDSKLRLVEVVGEMMKRDLIASHEADGLIRLYEEKNEAMIAANEAFESDGDVKELVETLLLIVKHANFGAAPRCSSPRNASSGAPRSPRPTMTPPSSPVSDAGTASTESFFAARLIEILGSKGRLATWQMELLLQLLAKGDDRIFAAMDVYNEQRDARELVDTLWRLCDLTAWQQNKSKIISQWIRPLERDGQVTPKGVLEKLVESRDDRLVAAFVVFLGDNNGAEFADTLVRLARLEGLKNGTIEADPASDDERQEMQLILARLANDAGEYGLSAEDVSAVESLVKSHDAKILAAFDVYRENLDAPDFVDTLKRILSTGTRLKSPRSPGSRASAMEKQLLHFVSELSELKPNEIAALKQAIARNDSVIEGAVEVYEADKDEDDLKDTLKRIAIHLASKAPA